MKSRSSSRVEKSGTSTPSSASPKRRGRKVCRRLVISDDSDIETVIPDRPNLNAAGSLERCTVIASVSVRDLKAEPLGMVDISRLRNDLNLALNAIFLRATELHRSLDILSGRSSTLAYRCSSSCNSSFASDKNCKSVTRTTVVNGTPLKRQRIFIPTPAVSQNKEIENTSVDPSTLSPTARYYYTVPNPIPDRFWKFVQEYLKFPSEAERTVLSQFAQESNSMKSAEYYRSPHSSKTHWRLSTMKDKGTGDQRKRRDNLKRSASSVSTKVETRKRRFSADKTDTSAEMTDNNSCNESQLNGHPNQHIAKIMGSLNNIRQDGGPTTRRTASDIKENSIEFVDWNDRELCSSWLNGIEEDDNEVTAELIDRETELKLLQTANFCVLQQLLKSVSDAETINNCRLLLQETEASIIELSRHLADEDVSTSRLQVKKDQEELWKAIQEKKKLIHEFKSLAEP
ncbi:hypothetical protein T4B_12816 [Trichinella pseudospiralis]|uniref:Uncharacterized protein n=1 Tax=Trichinella pseudospiralis TaxID=6337 RepID=A0A0V1EDC6_TRIPS|nr:hypothetical protein T4E_12353 [Trichinella pseudospiralis]KRY71811.1 hypothetical protein T4A_13017 [Trichinella pseudospiralis]KRY71812.1 hypothetical protein T4A_13017 [Trichinella pseudospiralis]KRZ25331.1 hypothetical protein T4B_12816 [Trichinella pseudospiralis]KRZ37482.1 hypothetical protein T4C_14111 [Trichinella pseudospiralis]